MRDPYVIMVAPNGARRTKSDHPNLPMTLDEIVSAVADAQAAGAQCAHVHVRDDDGNHILDARSYLRLTEALRQRCGDDLVIQITTEAVDRYTAEQQRALVRDVKPEAVSIALRELFAQSVQQQENYEFLQWAYAENIAVQWIVYDPSELKLVGAMIEAGVAPKDVHLLFVLGRYSLGQRSKPSDLVPFLTALQNAPTLESAAWSVCAFGQGETACLATALALGGDVRVGFENNLLNADGSIAKSNAERVSAIIKCADGLGFPIADPKTARAKIIENRSYA